MPQMPQLSLLLVIFALVHGAFAFRVAPRAGGANEPAIINHTHSGHHPVVVTMHNTDYNVKSIVKTMLDIRILSNAMRKEMQKTFRAGKVNKNDFDFDKLPGPIKAIITPVAMLALPFVLAEMFNPRPKKDQKQEKQVKKAAENLKAKREREAKGHPAKDQKREKQGKKAAKNLEAKREREAKGDWDVRNMPKPEAEDKLNPMGELLKVVFGNGEEDQQDFVGELMNNLLHMKQTTKKYKLSPTQRGRVARGDLGKAISFSTSTGDRTKHQEELKTLSGFMQDLQSISNPVEVMESWQAPLGLPFYYLGAMANELVHEAELWESLVQDPEAPMIEA